MIICASRRTDIPAFHSEWMMNRLRAGYALVRNPVCEETVYRVDLSPDSVGCIYFMTKNPEPMIRHLDEIEDLGHKSMFQITVTPYGKDTEPGVPDKGKVADSLKEVSEILGKKRVVWRYDPVFFDGRHSMKYHERKFRLFCSEFSGYTERCIFGFLDVYSKFNRFGGPKFSVPSPMQREEFMRFAGPVAKEYGIRPTCCLSGGRPEYGIGSEPCIDGDTMRSLNIPYDGTPGRLRDGCGCIRNIDVGAYDTCMHDCVYCYANSVSRKGRSLKEYDPKSEILFGRVSEDTDTVPITDRRSRLGDF